MPKGVMHPVLLLYQGSKLWVVSRFHPFTNGCWYGPFDQNLQIQNTKKANSLGGYH